MFGFTKKSSSESLSFSFATVFFVIFCFMAGFSPLITTATRSLSSRVGLTYE
jgi:hypothetical protein